MMFNKLLEAINEAEERELEERSFDLMLEDFDFDEDIDNCFEFSEGLIQRIQDRKYLQAEAARLRKMFLNRVPKELQSMNNDNRVDIDDNRNKTIFTFSTPKNLAFKDEDAYDDILKHIKKFKNEIEKESKFKLLVMVDDTDDIQIMLTTKRLSKSISESEDLETEEFVEELLEGFFSDLKQRVYDEKNLGERADELRKKFKSKIPVQAKPYFNNIILDLDGDDRKVIFNFSLPKNLKNKDNILYNTIKEALTDFIIGTIQPATIFKVYLDTEGSSAFKIRLSSKRVVKD